MRVMMVDTHLPHYVSIEANEIKRVIKEFEEKNGYTPSSEYISEKTNIDLQKVNDIIGAITVPERFDNLDVSVPDTSKEVFESFEDFYKHIMGIKANFQRDINFLQRKVFATYSGANKDIDTQIETKI